MDDSRPGPEAAEPRLARGILVVFEGIDGCGKSLQAKLLADRLRAQGLDVVRSKEPTDGRFKELFREWFDGERPPTAEEELQVFHADRKEHVETLIQPALDDGKVVILDRYFLSTVAYQGARGLDPDEIMTENEGFAPIPDVVFLMDLDVMEALTRITKRGEGTTTFEKADSLEKVNRIFRSIERDYLHRIDGRKAIEEIAAEVYEILYQGPLFAAACRHPDEGKCKPGACAFPDHPDCAYPTIEQP